MDLIVTGGGDFSSLAKRLKAEGDGDGLRKSVRDSIKRTAKPLGRFVAVSAGSSLPRRGGLGFRVAGATATVTGGVTSSGVRATLKLRAKGYDLQAMDRGRLRHPTFGNRNRWVTQTVQAEAFTRPFKEAAPVVAREIEKGLHEVAARIEKG